MTLLDRYIFRQFFQNLLLVLGSLVAIYLLVDFFERIDDFTEKGKPLSLAVKYFILKIPFIYDQMSPVCILLAGIITLGLLNRNHELMSFNAGGLSVNRIILPLLAASFLFTLFTIASAQWILPPTVSKTNTIWHEEVHNRIANGIVRDGQVFYKGENGIYSFHRPDPTRHSFTEFAYTAFNENYDVILYLTANSATWSKKGWIFENGQQKTLNGDGQYDLKLYSTLQLQLPDSPENFFIPAYRVDELSLFQLLQNALTDYRNGDRQGLVDVNKRFSFIFLGIPLLILSIPIILFMHKKWNRDLAMAIPMSCSLAFIAWALWSATQSLSQAAYMNPIAASWTIHLLLTLVGGGMLWGVNRS
ncbi:MAG: LptF/LptG family permease [Desulfobulbaceae bacterium]|nr:LptF/LptG family permease [Desulfobulbaceae bacterium]